MQSTAQGLDEPPSPPVPLVVPPSPLDVVPPPPPVPLDPELLLNSVVSEPPAQPVAQAPAARVATPKVKNAHLLKSLMRTKVSDPASAVETVR